MQISHPLKVKINCNITAEQNKTHKSLYIFVLRTDTDTVSLRFYCNLGTRFSHNMLYLDFASKDLSALRCKLASTDTISIKQYNICQLIWSLAEMLLIFMTIKC